MLYCNEMRFVVPQCAVLCCAVLCCAVLYRTKMEQVATMRAVLVAANVPEGMAQVYAERMVQEGCETEEILCDGDTVGDDEFARWGVKQIHIKSIKEYRERRLAAPEPVVVPPHAEEIGPAAQVRSTARC